MLRRGVRVEGDSIFAVFLSVQYVPGWRVTRYLVSHDCLWRQTKNSTHYSSWGTLSLLMGK